MGIRFRCNACEKKLNVKSFLGGKRGICPHCGAKIAIPPAEGQPPVAAGAKKAALVGAPSPAGGQAHAGTSVRRNAGEVASPVVATAGEATHAAFPQPTAEVMPAARPQETPQPARPDALAEAPGAVWYVRPPSGGQYGPASAEYMRRWIEEGRISADSLVWRDGWADWQPASTALAGLIDSGPKPATPVAAVGQPALVDPTEIAAPESSIARRGHRRGRRSANRFALLWVIGLGLLAIGLLVTLLLVVT